MSSYRIAPAVRAALDQATLLWPRRSRASDGTIGDTAHRSRISFHNPSMGDGVWNDRGTVLAFDITHDPADGCDAHRLVRELVRRNDQRVHEVISRGQIWTRSRSREGWRTYGGVNPHDKHAHVSVAHVHRNDTSPWWTPPSTTPDSEEFVMASKAELEAVVNEAVAKITGGIRRRDAEGKVVDADPQNISNADIYTKLEELIAAVKAR